MRCPIAILSTGIVFLDLLNVFGQNTPINQFDSHLIKTGKWEYRNANGVLERSGSYLPVKVKEFGPAELIFTEGLDLTTSSDSVWKSIQIGEWINYDQFGRLEEIKAFDSAGVRLRTDSYVYGNSGLEYIIRSKAPNHKISFISAGDDSVELTERTYTKPLPANEFVSIPLTMKNLSSKKNRIHIHENRSLNLLSETLEIGPGDSVLYIAEIKVPAGQLTNQIVLSNSKWVFPFELKSLVYDLTTNNFLNAEKRSIPNTFYYLRQGDEFQMEIVSRDSDITVISLAREFTKIVLDPGEYFLEIVSPSGRSSKKVVLK